MNTENLLLACYCCFISVLVFNISNCSANSPLCAPSSCGDINKISFPFRLKSDPQSCGALELSCEDNSTVLYLNQGKVIVKAINYNDYTIRVMDPGVAKEDDCSSLPHLKFSIDNFPMDGFRPIEGVVTVKVIRCVKPVHSKTYLDASSCIRQRGEFYRYGYVGRIRGVDLREGCSVEAWTLIQSPPHPISFFIEIHRQMAFGFELDYSSAYFSTRSEECYSEINGGMVCYIGDASTVQRLIRNFNYAVKDLWGYIRVFFDYEGSHFNIKMVLQQIRDTRSGVRGSKIEGVLGTMSMEYNGIPTAYFLFQAFGLLVLYIAGRSICGTPFVIAFFIYIWRRRHRSSYHIIEEFLQGQNNLIMPIRYAYSDIKNMTSNFSDILGKGGFGSVYKGKLRSGQFAAIKMLENSKANGQDFINEVATIGRIYHSNIVRLIGFCSQGSKHALVYEFMSNGSLDTHIFSREKSIALSWDKLYEISLGVARGIEYLHRGCDIQILHFDIKPHNILLDENLAPKLSDFGLAKLYPKMDTIASLTAARGTIGYMAPELFYKNIGRVSYKADVYSFGMLLLEMTGKRKNLKVPTEDGPEKNLSEIYYPFWVYDKLVDGNLEIEDATIEEENVVRKMIITGLWCIQMQPSNRPSMDKVVEMLEGNSENLQFPPRPLLFPIQSPEKDEEEASSVSVLESLKTTFQHVAEGPSSISIV